MERRSTNSAPADPLLDFDWLGHWRRLSLARRDDISDLLDPQTWERFGRGEDWRTLAADNPSLELLEPYLAPTKTLIDVGAGGGQLAAPLAARLRRVVAVEPAAGMRDQIPRLPNLEVVAGTWEEAEVEPADLVLSAHVLYFVPEPMPFLEKMERLARERVCVLLRQNVPPGLPAAVLAEFRGRGPERWPAASDLLNLLLAQDRAPDLVLRRFVAVTRFATLEEAAGLCRLRIADWDDARGRPILERTLRPGADGGYEFRATNTLGLVTWTP